MRYKALLIDFDGVIRLWPSQDAELEGRFGLRPGEIGRAAFAPEILQDAVTGVISDEEWRLRIARTLSTSIGEQRAADAIVAWSALQGAVDAMVLSTIAQCRKRVRVALLTNATSRLTCDLACLGLSDHFDAVINSSNVGVAKPKPAIFQHALTAVAASPRETIFVDDSATNVAAARALGIEAHMYVDHADLAAMLRNAGISGD
jgi:HAD superfamily hydrolase (TIGR01509 family)